VAGGQASKQSRTKAGKTPLNFTTEACNQDSECGIQDSGTARVFAAFLSVYLGLSAAEAFLTPN
jgi:hypothetical protein